MKVRISTFQEIFHLKIENPVGKRAAMRRLYCCALNVEVPGNYYINEKKVALFLMYLREVVHMCDVCVVVLWYALK
jgi:hypothetical protein